MIICPKCGAKLSSTVRGQPSAAAKDSEGEGNTLPVVQLLKCPKCGVRFLSAAQNAGESAGTANVKNKTERIKAIRREFMQSLKALRERIRALETERAGLMTEIEQLRKTAEARVTALEGEVTQMREDKKALKELLSIVEKPQVVPPSPEKPSPS